MRPEAVVVAKVESPVMFRLVPVIPANVEVPVTVSAEIVVVTRFEIPVTYNAELVIPARVDVPVTVRFEIVDVAKLEFPTTEIAPVNDEVAVDDEVVMCVKVLVAALPTADPFHIKVPDRLYKVFVVVNGVEDDIVSPFCVAVRPNTVVVARFDVPTKVLSPENDCVVVETKPLELIPAFGILNT